MDDLTEKLDRLLGSPDGMKRIEDMMAAFGAGMPASPPPSAPAPKADAPTDLSSLLSGGNMDQLLKLLPLLSQVGKEDDSTALLHALRPHLKDERQKRLDEAGQMLKLMRLLPLLKDLGKGDDRCDE